MFAWNICFIDNNDMNKDANAFVIFFRNSTDRCVKHQNILVAIRKQGEIETDRTSYL